jgi:hypothetical protein
MSFPFLAPLRRFSFLGNSLEDWAIALAVAVLATAAMAFVRAVVLRRLAAASAVGETRLDDLVVKMLSGPTAVHRRLRASTSAAPSSSWAGRASCSCRGSRWRRC